MFQLWTPAPVHEHRWSKGLVLFNSLLFKESFSPSLRDHLPTRNKVKTSPALQGHTGHVCLLRLALSNVEANPWTQTLPTRVTNELLQLRMLPYPLCRGLVAAQRFCHNHRLSSCFLLFHEIDTFKIQNGSEGEGLRSQTCQLRIIIPSTLRAGKKERGRRQSNTTVRLVGLAARRKWSFITNTFVFYQGHMKHFLEIFLACLHYSTLCSRAFSYTGQMKKQWH